MRPIAALLSLFLAACGSPGGEEPAGGGAPGAGGAGGAAGQGGAGGAGGGCAPARPCTESCDPCTGSCDRGRLDEVKCACVPTGGRRIVGLYLTPATLALEVGATGQLLAHARFDDCTELEVTGTVDLATDAPALVSLSPDGTVEALAPGEANVTASSGAVVSGPARITIAGEIVVEPPGELRGVWITRFAFSSRATLEGIIDRAAAANFNAVFVQIRGNGDAYYRSSHEPWAKGLTGTLGRDPGWDPLQVAVDRAHFHGLELHAYFNALSAWPVSSGAVPLAEGPVQHPLRDHPEWLAVTSADVNEDGEYLWFTPGNPALRAHLAATAEELLTNYDVDGLHLDRIRSPGSGYSHDAVTEAAYQVALAADPGLSHGDFMREQVNLTVEALDDALLRARPTARHSAAVWGIYEPLPGCSTSQGRRDYHQDSLEWLRRGTMDALVPMTYWPIAEGACTDWATLTDGFVAESAGRQIWAGMHALERRNGEHVFDFPAVRARIEHARAGGAAGTVVFASTYLDEGAGRWEAYVGDEAAPGPFAEPAVPPVMDWR